MLQWYIAMWKDPAFRANTSSRYAALRTSAWSDAWFDNEVRAQAAAVQASAARTFTRWSAAYAADKLQLTAPVAADYAASYNGSITALHDWLLARLRWMDTQLLSGAGTNSTTASQTTQGAGAAGGGPAAASGANGGSVQNASSPPAVGSSG
jgi:hypothetical protein